jgi:N-hydroxyarylamine O-acetyltransferase
MTALGDSFAGLTRPDQHNILLDLVRRGTEPPGLDTVEFALFLGREIGVDVPVAALSAASTPAAVACLLWSLLAGVSFEDAEPVQGAGEWQTELLDLDRYLQRIGLAAAPEPDLASLRRIHWAHATSIGFHNIDVLLGRPVSHELTDIQRKLLIDGRGATCVEHNLLLAAALERLGFNVTRLAGRPRIGRRVVLPLTHMALLVQADGQPWLVDVGFGGEGPTEPVPIEGGEVGRPPWQWRVVGVDEYVLQLAHKNRWVDLYSFELHPQRFVDFLVTYYYSVTYPGIPFTNMLIVHKVAERERQGISGNTYTKTTADGERFARSIAVDEIDDILAAEFDIKLSGSELAALRRRIRCV